MDVAPVTSDLVSVDNPDEGDIYVAPDGDSRMLDGSEAEALAIATRIDTFLGEWFIDTSAGTPWRERILSEKGMTPAKSREILVPVIMSRGTVKRVLRLDVTIVNRHASVSFEALLNNGETAEGSA